MDDMVCILLPIPRGKGANQVAVRAAIPWGECFCRSVLSASGFHSAWHRIAFVKESKSSAMVVRGGIEIIEIGTLQKG